MTEQRNKSKSKRFWKYGSETREQRSARIHATKKNSKKKTIRAKYAKPKETPELKAERASKAMEAARKVFEQWLAKPRTIECAQEYANDFARWVRFALNDSMPEEEKGGAT